MKSKAIAPDRNWEAECALRTITEAEKHKRDPKLMAEVNRLASEQKQALSRVARMKPTKSNSKPKTSSKKRP